MLHTFKGVIFDMDGLMLDTEPIYRKSMQQAAVELGYDITDQLQNRLFGRSISDWRTTLSQISGEDYPQFSKRSRQIWEQYVQEVGVAQKSGLVDLLNQMDQDSLRKDIATSSSKPDALLCLGELARRFEVIVTGDEVKQGKPAPDIFLLAAQRLTISPEHCLVLEDSESGAQAALAAGMSVIIVPDLHPPSNELVAYVHRVCSSRMFLVTRGKNVISSDVTS
jgi:HAD superfamily hydrolase (TIGR01509 family)